MKNHKEMFEALLAGETLVSKTNPHRTICFENNHLSLFGFNDYNLAVIPYGEFEIKPKTININGFEVPEPVRFVIEIGTAYYIPIITADIIMPKCYYWCNNEQDNSYLVKGLVHLTPESALLHAKALLSFTQKE